MNVLCIIPARGGSKGVIRKNLRKIGGKTLVERSIITARESGVCNYILVTTDDIEIQKEAIDKGAEAPFIRPSELSSDLAPTIQVLIHAINMFEKYSNKEIDTVIILEPTSPFRRPSTIVNALELYKKRKCGSVISVCQLERKPENIFIKKSNSLERLCKGLIPYNRRQDMTLLCRLSSVVYVTGKKELLSNNQILNSPISYINTDEIESINIDSELDLLLAQTVEKNLNTTN